MLGRQRQDTLFSCPAGVARQARRVLEMNLGSESDSGEFEQRTRALLIDSADALPGAVRSRLTQARYAALAARPSRLAPFARRWVPLGAAVATLLALLV